MQNSCDVTTWLYMLIALAESLKGSASTVGDEVMKCAVAVVGRGKIRGLEMQREYLPLETVCYSENCAAYHPFNL